MLFGIITAFLTMSDLFQFAADPALGSWLERGEGGGSPTSFFFLMPPLTLFCCNLILLIPVAPTAELSPSANNAHCSSLQQPALCLKALVMFPLVFYSPHNPNCFGPPSRFVSQLFDHSGFGTSPASPHHSSLLHSSGMSSWGIITTYESTFFQPGFKMTSIKLRVVSSVHSYLELFALELTPPQSASRHRATGTER